MQEAQVRSLSREDPLEKKTANNSSILAWEIPWTQEPGGPQSMDSQRAGCRLPRGVIQHHSPQLSSFCSRRAFHWKVWEEEVGRGASRYPCLFLGCVCVCVCVSVCLSLNHSAPPPEELFRLQTAHPCRTFCLLPSPRALR